MLVKLVMALISGHLPVRHVMYAYLRKAARSCSGTPWRPCAGRPWSTSWRATHGCTTMPRPASARCVGPAVQVGNAKLPQLLACAGGAWQLARACDGQRQLVAPLGAALPRPSAAPSLFAVSVDMHEQYGLSLPLELQPLVVQGFHATDDLEQGFSSQVVRTGHCRPPAPDAVAVLDDVGELTGLQRGAGAGAGTLAALHSLQRKYDATAAGKAAAV